MEEDDQRHEDQDEEVETTRSISSSDSEVEQREEGRCTMSVDALQELLLKDHDDDDDDDDLRQILLSVDLNIPMVIERFDANYGYNDIELISRNRHGTLLHAACHDRDGARGEDKIKILLEKASSLQHYLPIFPELLTLGEVWEEEWWYGPPGVEEQQQNSDGKKYGPLYVLLFDNPHSTLESIRLLVTAWPDAVHQRGLCDSDDDEEVNENMLSKFIRTTCAADNDDDNPQRLVEVCAILLEAAAKTPFGAEGMLSTVSFRRQEQVEESSPSPCGPAVYYSNWLESSGSSYRNTPLEVVLKKVYAEPALHQLVDLFLRYWPDALTFYCQEQHCSSSLGLNNNDFHPMTRVANDDEMGRFSRRSQLELLYAFLRHSSVQALAHGLIRADRTGCSGFQAMQGILLDKAQQHRGGDQDDPTAGSNDDCLLLDQVRRSRLDLVFRKDAQGRTLLHYLSANAVVFPYEPIRDENSKKLWMHRENSRMERIVTVARCICSVDPAAFSVRDKQGLNPLQFAIVRGKGWGTGLKSLLECTPLVSKEVLCERTRDGLYPFMLAATVESLYGHLETIFELLRRNPELIHG